MVTAWIWEQAGETRLDLKFCITRMVYRIFFVNNEYFNSVLLFWLSNTFQKQKMIPERSSVNSNKLENMSQIVFTTESFGAMGRTIKLSNMADGGHLEF